MSAVDPGQAGDRYLLKRMAQGDRTAFTHFFNRYAPTAMATARRILRHPNLAEEIVQEAFLAVWRDPGRYWADRGTARAWLMSIVHHRAVDLVRREESQRKRAEEADGDRATDTVPADPCHVVVEKIGQTDERNAVRRALEDLPPRQRQIIELMYFGGLSQSRISERLSLPLGTVKSRTLLGMRRLKAALAGLER